MHRHAMSYEYRQRRVTPGTGFFSDCSGTQHIVD